MSRQLEEAREKIIEIYQSHGFTDVSVAIPRGSNRRETRNGAGRLHRERRAKGAVSRSILRGTRISAQEELRKEMKTRGRTLIFS